MACEGFRLRAEAEVALPYGLNGFRFRNPRTSKVLDESRRGSGDVFCGFRVYGFRV